MDKYTEEGLKTGKMVIELIQRKKPNPADISNLGAVACIMWKPWKQSHPTLHGGTSLWQPLEN